MRTQDDLLEDLLHAHAHSNERLRELSHEAVIEIKRLNRQIRALEIEQTKTLLRRFADKLLRRA